MVSPVLSFQKSITSHKIRAESSKLENDKLQPSPRREPTTDRDEEKEKEIARLRWQNAQLKLRFGAFISSSLVDLTFLMCINNVFYNVRWKVNYICIPKTKGLVCSVRNVSFTIWIELVSYSHDLTLCVTWACSLGLFAIREMPLMQKEILRMGLSPPLSHTWHVRMSSHQVTFICIQMALKRFCVFSV